ncbi:hypothetical protein, partial [Pseudomonas saliphila]|uniref:hypothetical protein n=1 Tax=Pseudomonas saliphila TaxID=2586906 RepID=UPI0019D5123A
MKLSLRCPFWGCSAPALRTNPVGASERGPISPCRRAGARQPQENPREAVPFWERASYAPSGFMPSWGCSAP